MIKLEVSRNLDLPISKKKLVLGSQEIDEEVFEKEKTHPFIISLLNKGVIKIDKKEVARFEERKPPIMEKRLSKSFLSPEQFEVVAKIPKTDIVNNQDLEKGKKKRGTFKV